MPKEPLIGAMDYKSQTSVPFVYELNANEMVADIPGFKDSNGVIQEIINQFSLIEIL